MIDIKKFICPLLADHPAGITVRNDIHKALKDQGLEYKDSKIVPIEDKESEDENRHKWTIQDAKDGDVLCSGQIILLFKKWENSDWNFAIAYAGIDISGKLQITNEHWLISNYARPATKEQRDTLFAKMHEAGYEWDADKKELRKIDHTSTWSEEDEMMIEEIIYFIDEYQKSDRCKNEGNMQNSVTCRNWLKALKNRIGCEHKKL